MEQIVVGIDRSEGAAVALRWAVAEAELHGGRVTAFQAWDFLDQEAPFDPTYGQEKAEAALQAAVVNAIGAEAAASVEMLAVNDLAVRGLLEASADSDLLVVGARGLGGFRGLLLGSVSQHCVQAAKIPVAVVRPTHLSRAPGRVVVGIDKSEDSRRALAWALEEGRLRKAEVEVVHSWHPSHLAGNPYVIRVDPTKVEKEARSLLDSAIDAADTSGLAQPVRRTLSQRSAARAIVEAAEDADLAVVGSHGAGLMRSLLKGSVSHQVAVHAPCTVVVLPEVE